MARSRYDPSLARSAGARLMVSFSVGKEKPDECKADLTRSRASETVLAAIPTMLKPGRPRLLSPSISMSEAVNPNGMNDLQLAIIALA